MYTSTGSDTSWPHLIPQAGRAPSAAPGSKRPRVAPPRGRWAARLKARRPQPAQRLPCSRPATGRPRACRGRPNPLAASGHPQRPPRPRGRPSARNSPARASAQRGLATAAHRHAPAARREPTHSPGGSSASQKPPHHPCPTISRAARLGHRLGLGCIFCCSRHRRRRSGRGTWAARWPSPGISRTSTSPCAASTSRPSVLPEANTRRTASRPQPGLAAGALSI
mmetsp:Transcript_103858/g.332869  ORF Transcript_103858/g.332869 Transcript_103858/m.332869 type:complete len:224 (+) Transcript_103858:114-785(+)